MVFRKTFAELNCDFAPNAWTRRQRALTSWSARALEPTLGARDFSCAVSGFGQAFISDPREKPLERSAISLMAPNQSQARLNQFSPDFGRES